MKSAKFVRNFMLGITGSVLAVIVVFTLFNALGQMAVAQNQSAIVNPIPVKSQSTGQFQGLSQTFRDVAKAVSPAVVYISTEQTMQMSEQYQQFFNDEFFRRFFGVPEQREYKQHALGSGFIVEPDGYILTNNHVVEHADKIRVTLPDKREFDAKVVGTDPKSDVAVIKIDGKDLPVAPLGDSAAAAVGDWVLAIGTPFGLSQTVTAGIISAEGRANIGIVDYEDFIQTDAAINPGNSGGPLVNINGEVIGINTAIFSQSGGYQGIGFAIPINMAKHIMQSLMTHGKVVRGWLGVMIQPLTPEIAKSFGLKEATGALVGDVTKDSPADKAGIKRGDVIIALNGQAVDTPTTLRNLVAQTEIQKSVPVTIIRNGAEQTLQVSIGEQPASSQAEAATSEIEDQFGLKVQELTADIAKQLGYMDEKGVVIVAVKAGSPAQEIGLRPGDLIKEINRQPITSLADYQKVMAGLEKDQGLLLLVRRGDNTYYVVVEGE
ncbi:protease Do [Candidatus Vecturithrix granuli]|uniref:Probable periplasmic serine endoprotease DegP-like n=1 Tax=Vecturithrix granuli TaxID=1499967 RepID=A0A081C8L9_VECG1|nr:protease Do [Candidatus Vecturithrix granuli]